MATTNVRSGQILDGTVSRADLNVSGSAGTCVIAKAVGGTGISLNSSGGDAGTGDVTISIDQSVDHGMIAAQSITLNTATTNAGVNCLVLVTNTTGTPANNLGAGLNFRAETSTTISADQATVASGWSDVTHATRTAYLDFSLVNNATATASKMRLFGSGGLAVNRTTDPGAGYVDANTGFKVAGTDIFPLTIARGGTGQITALAARGSSGINVESRTTFSNANYTAVATDNYIATTTTAFTAQRTVTLPAANSQNPGERLFIADDGGAINGTNTLLVARAGSDTINGATSSILLGAARATLLLESDGVSNWTIVALSVATATQQTGLISPTGTTSTSGVMAGLNTTITPVKSGKIFVTICGFGINNTTGQAFVAGQMRYGTGTPPTNGAAVIGSAVGGQACGHSATANYRLPFSLSAVITGLALGTAVWLDIVQAVIGSGTASLFNIGVSAFELP